MNKLFLKACKTENLEKVKELLFIHTSFEENPFLLKDIEIDPSKNDNEALKITLNEAINTSYNEKRYNLWEITKLLLDDKRVKNNLSSEHKDKINILNEMMTSSEYNKELQKMSFELENLFIELEGQDCTTCFFGKTVDKKFICTHRTEIEDWCEKWEDKKEDCDFQMKAIDDNTFTFIIPGVPKKEESKK